MPISFAKYTLKLISCGTNTRCLLVTYIQIFSIQHIMPSDKRKAASSAKAPAAKKQKSAPFKVEKRETLEEGWLLKDVAKQRGETDLSCNPKRIRFISDTQAIKQGCEGLLYWMSRDHRIQDNWALIHAQQLAVENKLPLHICVCLLVPKSDLSTLRHYSFMLKGLEEVAKECKELDIQFHLLRGAPGEVLPGFVLDRGLGAVVTDFSPLRSPLQALESLRKSLPEDIPLIQPVDWSEALGSLQLDRTVREVDWALPGSAAGSAMLESFIDLRLKHFADHRNDPNSAALSQLSPWIRFGHLSAQRAALQVQRCGKAFSASVAPFIEELVVRRELTDNYCFYNNNYDNIKGAYEWAQKTLKDHAKDKREYLYTQADLEKAKTHDKLWNGAQYQMVSEGKMHGFLRMYWAKKILEWTSSPEHALSIALYLNDRYSLDGQDPNGFVGCMWSICGVHDQGWAERAVFGKIRYMNYKGCLRKFDVAKFETKYCPKKL